MADAIIDGETGETGIIEAECRGVRCRECGANDHVLNPFERCPGGESE